ncbi:uncharacterized protein LOC113206694 [Frankliniella occidentalis]|uniref:Uncharacterized protein LOC113206694 n=1 Tax=Frankliniella occidentalis TaxID=133901 RepID=A0A9C6UBD8_FRAOC|nr:uncharacterized protein LOC113206694 [Frankliniella occidentalis]
MKEQISLILETSEQLFSHEMGEDILKRIERELIHLNELFKCTISINTNTTVFPQLSGQRHLGKGSQHTCPPELLVSIKKLLSAAENFYSECNQVITNWFKENDF